MKKQVIEAIRSMGGTASYAGNTANENMKTMFITEPKTSPERESIESILLNKFGFGLPFKLKTN